MPKTDDTTKNFLHFFIPELDNSGKLKETKIKSLLMNSNQNLKALKYKENELIAIFDQFDSNKITLYTGSFGGRFVERASFII
ncbi:MAG: hypothetical protein ABIA04_04820 [Pseudomonadota bacterium]